MQSLWFVALVPPRKIIEKLAIHRQYAADHFNARHALKTTPHITLFPPLRQPGAVMSDVDHILRELFRTFSNFGIELHDFSSFQPRVIYVDVVENHSLQGLHATLFHLMVDQLRLQARRNRHKFRPHITIAHRDLDPKVFNEAWQHYHGERFRERFMAKSVILFRHDGKFWQEYSRYQIG